MSEFLAKQQAFATAAAKLILHAESIGLPVTLGDAYRDPRLHGAMGVKMGYGAANSCHKLRLAIDLNLIINGQLANAEQYKPLHDYWEANGGSPRIDQDLNHFSYEHEGHR